MKKRLITIVAVIMTLTLLVALCGCENGSTGSITVGKKHDEKKQKTILFLGDSIAEAVAGPSPVTERESYGYYGIIGNINGYKFFNRAVSGYKTSDLLEYIQRDDDGVNMTYSLLRSADIIHVSIIGNDVLGYDLTTMMLEAAVDDYTYEDRRLSIACENLGKIVDYIKSVNPNATLIFQTLYNPVGENSPLVGSYAASGLAALDYTTKNYHKLASRIITRMNDVLVKYQHDHSVKNLFGTVTYKPYELVDVYSSFENIYEKNPDRWATLFCPDGIHPANEGHAIIAAEIQKKLVELKLADEENYLSRYKSMKCAQLDRLYKDIINVSSAKNEVNISADMEDVTFAYFSQVRGSVPYYQHQSSYSGEHFAEDKVFSIDTFRMNGNDLTSLSAFGSNINPLSVSSYIKFGADGTYELKIVINIVFVAVLKVFIDNTDYPVNVSQMIGMDLDYLQDSFLTHMLPGFSYQDLEKTIQLVDGAMGVSIEGIDIDTQSARKMANELAQTGELVIRDTEAIGSEINFVWKSDYRLEHITSEVTGKTYTAIYVNCDRDTGEPYFRFTFTDNADSPDTIRATIDVVDLVLEGTDKNFSKTPAVNEDEEE